MVSAPRYGMKLSELTEAELHERTLLLKDITLGEILPRTIEMVLIVGGGEVEMVRFKSPEVRDWLISHKGAVVDMEVFPYQWEHGRQSGTIYNFVYATVKEHSNGA